MDLVEVVSLFLLPLTMRHSFHNHTLNYRPLLCKIATDPNLGNSILITSSSLVVGVRKEAFLGFSSAGSICQGPGP